MTRQEHLLTILSEECAEVSQRVSKALRFGISEIQPGQKLTNAQRIVDELNDVLAVSGMLTREGVLNAFDLAEEECLNKKIQKVEEYLKLSKSQGTLQ